MVLAGNATVKITLKDDSGNYIYDSSCPYNAVKWDTIQTRIYNESNNEIISDYDSSCEGTYYLKSGKYRIKVTGKKGFFQNDLPLYEKTLTVTEGNVYRISTTDMALFSLTLKDDEGNYIYTTTWSEGCTNTPNKGWHNLQLFIYNQSNNQTAYSDRLGCKTTFGLPEGTYKIKVTGKKSVHQYDLPLYEKTLTVTEGNVYRISTTDMALFSLTLKDDEGNYIYTTTWSEGCTNTPNKGWHNLQLFIYNQSNNQTAYSDRLGCKTTFGLPEGTYKIKVTGKKSVHQYDLPLYEKTITVKKWNLYELSTNDMALIGLTIKDAEGNCIYTNTWSEGCNLEPKKEWYNLGIRIYNESGEQIAYTENLGCKSTYGLPEGIYNLVIGGRETSSSGWVIASNVSHYEENDIHTIIADIEKNRFGTPAPKPLILGESYIGNISSGGWDLFSINVTSNENLLVNIEPDSSGVLELYAKYNRTPTLSNYDGFVKDKNIWGKYGLLISPTENGAYYLDLYGRQVNGVMDYNITAFLVDRYVLNVNPIVIINSSTSIIHIYGAGFVSGMKVELRSANLSHIEADTVVYASPKMIIAHLNTLNATLGVYDLAVVWSDTNEIEVESAVEVKDLQSGVLYSFPDVDINGGEDLTYDIEVAGMDDLFITLQKTTLSSYGNSWNGKLLLLKEGQEIASSSGYHDLFLHIINPEPGSYTIKIEAKQTGNGILNVFASLPELHLGKWEVGKIYCSYGSVWYQIEVPSNQNKLYFEAEGIGLWSHFDIYYEQYGGSYHWISKQGPQISMDIPGPVSGTYIVEFMDSAMLYIGNYWSEDQSRDVLIKADITSSFGQPEYLPSITGMSPNKGGNTGLVTVEINGGWLDPNSTVSLEHPSYGKIIAENVYGSADRTILTATFDLIGKYPGKWNLSVTNPRGINVTAPTPFIIEEGGEPELWVEIVGRDKIRAGRNQTYIVRFGNSGNVNVYDVLLSLKLPKDMDYFVKENRPSLSGVDWKDIPQGIEQDNNIVIPIWVYAAKAGSSNEVELNLNPKGNIENNKFNIQADLKYEESIFSQTGDFDYIETSPVFTNFRDSLSEKIVAQGGTIYSTEDFGASLKNTALSGFLGTGVQIITTVGTVALWEAAVLGVISPWIAVGATIVAVVYGAVSTFRWVVDYIKSAVDIMHQGTIVGSTTPEDKFGPTGFDPPDTPLNESKKYVSGNQNFYYKIDFWNHENATAPACDVYINDKLDENLNRSTFRFEEIGFLNQTIKFEPCQYFDVYVDMRPEKDLLVRVEGIFNEENGDINWTFYCLDPITLFTPEDPMAGFLPPITESGYEIGWASFSVDPTTGLSTGTKVENQAFVNFDGIGPFNPAPKEGPFFNTIDATKPTSNLTAALLNGNKIQLNWTGSDFDSGIKDYSIYYSIDNITYKRWILTNKTSENFLGKYGQTYFFYSIARDNAGNLEDSQNASVVFIFIPMKILLYDGWNLISIPLNTSNNSVSYFFNGTSVYSYNGSWSIPENIDNELGYWVKVDENINVTIVGNEINDRSIKLTEGWNLVGCPYLEEKEVTELFENATVFAYNSTWSSYIPNRTFNSLQTLKPGYGYWVKK